jgi:hypothetical protein
MERVDGGLIFSATDLINHLECPHLTHLQHRGRGRADFEPSRCDTTELVARKGDEQNRSYLDRLAEEDRESVQIDSATGREGKRQDAKRTVEAMKAGAEVIYQSVLFDRVPWRGYSDFLHRAEV